MTQPVTFQTDGRIGLVVIDHPPVNAISLGVTEGLLAALQAFDASPGLEALVLLCAGRTWVAGGDIAAFESPSFSAAPFNAFLGRLEGQTRPVVAALHGTVLGGGLELAMACHHRVAAAGTRLGLVCYGFIGNRMAEVYMREAEFLILEGAEPAQVDGAVEALGLAMGPCRMLDMAGVDVGARTVIERGKRGGGSRDPSYRALVQALFAGGRFGQKTGAGYYRYEGRTTVADPALTALAVELAARHGIRRRDPGAIGDAEIVERLLYPLINEGLKILEEGIAYRPGDIDVVWVAGFGFPDHRGGPMWMADTIGLARIAERLAHYAAVRGNAFGDWTPSDLLIELSSAGRSLKDR